MKQSERLIYLIKAFAAERDNGASFAIPETVEGQRYLLRALLNTRPAGLPSEEVLAVQDEYLQRRVKQLTPGITSLDQLVPLAMHRYVWRGDICTLAVDAIVNAANSSLTGCWAPNHLCIDNCIHTFAGVQLRHECDQIIKAQGHEEPTGRAKVTSAYNLPSTYVIHTVGPVANGNPTEQHAFELAQCYRNCYKAAKEKGCHSLAFCGISTGVFGFPSAQAARIAIGTVAALQKDDPQPLDVVFNVFSENDEMLYCSLLAN